MLNNNLIYIGAVSNGKWIKDNKELSRNQHQGYRVYSSIGVSSAITSNCGGLGKVGGLILVKEV